MVHSSTRIAIAAAILFAGLVAAPRAAAVVFTSQSAFSAALDAGSYLEDFNSTNPPNYSGGSAPFAYTVSAPGTSIYDSGSAIGTNSPNFPLVFTFTGGSPRAIGGSFFHSNISDVFQPGNAITLTYSDGTVDTYTPASASEFRGYIANVPLTSLTLSAPTGGTYLNVDNIIVGVPEPASLALLLPLAAPALSRRRHSR